MANVYLFDINKVNNNIDELINKIPYAFHRRIEKNKDGINKKTSILGYYLLTIFMEKDFNVNLNNTKIFYNDFDKPYIEDNLCFSISHCKNMVAVIISENACGIDIELFDETKNYNKLADKILTNKEQEMYKKNKDVVVKKWVQVEAYYKKRGTGIIYNSLNISLESENMFVNDYIDLENNKYYYAISCVDKELLIKEIDAI